MREKRGNRRRQQNEDSKVHIHYVTKKKKGPYALYLQIFLNCQWGIEIRFEFDCQRKKDLNLAQKQIFEYICLVVGLQYVGG